jgi:tRNA (guanine10-N2)-dimethyltransferase
MDGFIILEIKNSCSDKLEILAKRLSFSHEIFEILIGTSTSDALQKMNEYPWENVIKGSYAVRVKKLDKNKFINTLEFEKKAGSIIKTKVDPNITVNLENPSTLIRAVTFNGKIFIGKRIASINKKHFYELKPHKRPFFYPGSMSPKLARCMVNLTLIEEGQILLDPFCGTGGILIEGGIVGAKLIGTDLDPKMVEGTKENLTYCGFNNWNVFRADARRLKLDKLVDAIVTDPPYGISASTRGETSENLYKQSMIALQDIIKEGGLFCLATPHYLNIDEILEGTKFIITEQHHIRMHKSLTRVISVLEKKEFCDK